MATSLQPRSRLLLVALAAPIVGAAAGCLEREETIVVAGDGSVRVEHVVKGDQGDFDQGAASYPVQPPFQVERQVEHTKDGPRVTVNARAQFARVEDMPRFFAAGDDPNLKEALHLETTLTTWQADGRKYYRFERRYRPRDWANYRVFHRRALGPIEGLLKQGQKIREQPLAERVRVVRALSDYERMKRQYQVDLSVRTVVTGRDTELQRLELRRRIADYFDHQIDHRALAEDLARDPAALDAAGVEILAAFDAMVRKDVAELLGLTDRQVAMVERQLRLLQHGFDVTSDLEDERFVVRVELPGDLVGHNGNEVVGGQVVWKFDGRDLQDREQRLVVVSAVKGG